MAYYKHTNELLAQISEAYKSFCVCCEEHWFQETHFTGQVVEILNIVRRQHGTKQSTTLQR